MASESRTKKSIRNSVVALVMYFINLVLQFYSRKIFLEYLGTEILGLNTTAVNILQFLNLAELGIWSAIAPSLYKPLSLNDEDEINRIVTFNGLLYKRIAIFIICASIIVMLFFPKIFGKTNLPIWYAYASFSVLLFSSLLGYFVNYRQFVLSADQKDYKIQYSYKLTMAVKILCQMMSMVYLPNPYFWWLILELIFAIIGSISLSVVIKHTYPFLRTTKDTFSDLKKSRRIKQLFVQKISGYVIFQSSPLIIYGIANLSLVTLYGNYLLIIQGLISLLSAMFNSMLAGIGNLVVTTDIDYALNVFDQLFSFRFWIISILSYGTWIFGQYFIIWWIGEDYLLQKSTLSIMVLTFFFYTNRYIVYDYLSAYGYFGDVWASVVEVGLNISLSIILGILWGLNGVLMGVLVSIVIISLFWKPYYLFKIKIKKGYFNFWKSYAILSIPLILSIILIEIIFKSKHGFPGNIMKFIIFSIILSVTYYIIHPSFRYLVERLYKR